MAGLLASLNTYWSGFKKYIPSFARVPLMVEKVRAATVSGYLNLLPYADQYTEETPEIRRAYRVMMRDPTVKSGLYDKVFSVAALDVQLEPASDSPRDEMIADFVRDSIVKFASGGLRSIVEEMAFPALVDGHSVCEKMWDVQDRGQWKSKYVLRGLKSKDSNNIQLMGDEYRNIIALRGTTFNGGRLYDPKDFVFFKTFSLFNAQAGMSDLRACYRAFWIMDTAWKCRAIHLDKFSNPFLKGTYKEGDVQGKAGLEAAMANTRSENWISIPSTAVVEAVTLSQRGTSDFEAAIKDLREEILLSIVGAYLQSITSDGGSGQRGNSKIHKGSTEIVKWHLGQCIADSLNDRRNGLIPEIVDLNFADADYPFLTLGGMNDEDLAASLTIDQGLSGLGIALSRKDLYRRYGRQKPVDALDALMPGGGQGGTPGVTPGLAPPPGMGGQPPGAPRLPAPPSQPRPSGPAMFAEKGDGKWITINGAHVQVDGDGDITKGPPGLMGDAPANKTGHPEIDAAASKQGTATEKAEAIYSASRHYGDMQKAGKVKAVAAVAESHMRQALESHTANEIKDAVHAMGHVGPIAGGKAGAIDKAVAMTLDRIGSRLRSADAHHTPQDQEKYAQQRLDDAGYKEPHKLSEGPGGGGMFATTFPVSAGRPLVPNGTVNSVGATRQPIQREAAGYGS